MAIRPELVAANELWVVGGGIATLVGGILSLCVVAVRLADKTAKTPRHMLVGLLGLMLVIAGLVASVLGMFAMEGFSGYY